MTGDGKIDLETERDLTMGEFLMEVLNSKVGHLTAKRIFKCPALLLFAPLERFWERMFLPFGLLNLQKLMVEGLLMERLVYR